jgi:hypothetical protein
MMSSQKIIKDTNLELIKQKKLVNQQFIKVNLKSNRFFRYFFLKYLLIGFLCVVFKILEILSFNSLNIESFNKFNITNDLGIFILHISILGDIIYYIYNKHNIDFLTPENKNFFIFIQIFPILKELINVLIFLLRNSEFFVFFFKFIISIGYITILIKIIIFLWEETEYSITIQLEKNNNIDSKYKLPNKTIDGIAFAKDFNEDIVKLSVENQIKTIKKIIKYRNS